MLIQFTKNSGKSHTIKYIRDNGTVTWMQANAFFVRHDLSHYALEKTLGYKTAFNGMINNGMNIRDFESREKRMSMSITAEAWYAENMANLFLIEVEQGNFEDFNLVQQKAFSTMNKKLTAPLLSLERIEDIRIYLRELLQQWNQLPPGQTLELSFSL